MSKIEPEIIKGTRPAEMRGKIDRYLGKAASDVKRKILQIQREFEYDTCQLEPEMASHLAAICVEFAEDIHCDLGLWKALEHWNREFFQTPLPFLVEQNSTEGDSLERFDPRRIQHLLWRMIQFIKDEEDEGLIISPNHRNLETMASGISKVLGKTFATMPTDSSIGQLLKMDHPEDHIVKRKLIWLGSQSYMFRHFFAEYMQLNAPENPNESYSVVDDFICQECTVWSGLGALEILVEVLNLNAEDRSELLSWSQRHLAVYEVLDAVKRGQSVDYITACNRINGESYRIEMGGPWEDSFEPGNYVFGALNRWRGKWGWSGMQRNLGALDSSAVEKLCEDFTKQMPRVTYRYCTDRAEAAVKHGATAHSKFVDHYGSEMRVFEDGHAMAESEQARISKAWDKLSRKELKRLNKKRGDNSGGLPQIQFPDSLVNDTSVAVFSDPIESSTMFSRMDLVVSFLKGENDDPGRLWALLTCTESPPSMVRYLLKEYGARRLATALKLESHPDDLVVEYALRSLKGEFFRERYPHVAVV